MQKKRESRWYNPRKRQGAKVDNENESRPSASVEPIEQQEPPTRIVNEPPTQPISSIKGKLQTLQVGGGGISTAKGTDLPPPTNKLRLPAPSTLKPIPPWHLAPVITDKLQQYRDLQLEEKRLVRLIHRLARQVALYGPLVAPAERQIELEDEQTKLAQLRAEITKLEQQLDNELRDYANAQADRELEQELDVRRQRIELLELEIAQKQELAQIYEKNIRLLEEKRAHFDEHTPIYVFSEIDETTRELERVRAECRALEVMLEQQYAILPERLRSISLRSGRTIAIFVEETIASMSSDPSESQHWMQA